MNLKPFDKKFESFGWSFLEVDGHNHDELKTYFNNLKKIKNKPKVILANTIKGKGVSFMENSVQWHYKSPDEDELKEAIKQIQDA